MTKKFHERFQEVEINKEEVLSNTLNRFVNMIFDWPNGYLGRIEKNDAKRREIESFVVSYGGVRYNYGRPGIKNYLYNDIYRALKMIEGLYHYLINNYDKPVADKLDEYVREIINFAELDINIKWNNGIFSRKGAELLDRELVDKTLEWLKIEEFETVYEPFQDSLEHLMKSSKEPDRLHDGISNAFEALEGMAKIVCSNEGTLHGNKSRLIKRMGVSPQYEKLLNIYIDIGNPHRHSGSSEKPKPDLTEHEVESYIYLTGIFLRLVMVTKETWTKKVVIK